MTRPVPDRLLSSYDLQWTDIKRRAEEEIQAALGSDPARVEVVDALRVAGRYGFAGSQSGRIVSALMGLPRPEFEERFRGAYAEAATPGRLQSVYGYAANRRP